ncbi:hypothetical protein FACS1894200_14230 [Spirochaetia bacterium]|nr:hypothetical protein FACS1894200_14230 [Spirochaetia bacterium]
MLTLDTVMYILFMKGYSSRPSSFNHFRMLSTAKSAVSLLVPTLTNPLFLASS